MYFFGEVVDWNWLARLGARLEQASVVGWDASSEPCHFSRFSTVNIQYSWQSFDGTIIFFFVFLFVPRCPASWADQLACCSPSKKSKYLRIQTQTLQLP